MAGHTATPGQADMENRQRSKVGRAQHMRGSCDGGQGWDPLSSPLSALLRHHNSDKRTGVLRR